MTVNFSKYLYRANIHTHYNIYLSGGSYRQGFYSYRHLMVHGYNHHNIFPNMVLTDYKFQVEFCPSK